MRKGDLKASKDSQGFYTVTEHGHAVWEGFADSAAEAKEHAVQYHHAEEELRLERMNWS